MRWTGQPAYSFSFDPTPAEAAAQAARQSGPKPFVATGACSSCPHRGTCHEPRKRIQDPQHDVGRHYGCFFYQSIEQDLRRRPQLAPRRWWRSLFGRRP